jgi:polyhydroxybutyrate depolymerase
MTRNRSHALIAVTVAAMLLVALSAACGGRSSHSPAAESTTTRRAAASVTATSTGPGPAPSGCGHAIPTGTSTDSFTLSGHARTFIVHVPPGYADARPTPLVLNLHGSGSTATQQEFLTGMNTTADTDRFIVVYPQAVIPSGAGFVWNIPGVPLIGGSPVPAGAANDEVFLEALVSYLRGYACIDTKRVYSTGFSGGARMSSQLACDASTTFAAVGPVSGLRLPTPCPSPRAVPVISFHGLLDPVDPYRGNGQAYWTYSVPVAAQRWAAHNRCVPTPASSRPDPGATLTAYGGCAGGAAVELYTLAFEGHEWPGGPKLPRAVTRVLGPQSTAIDANAVMWKFFSEHPMP